MSNINEEIVSKILSTQHDLNRIKILKWDVQGNIIKPGYNMTTEVNRLIIDYSKNGKILQKHIFVKTPLDDTKFSPFRGIAIYDKEPYIYGTLLPEIYSIEDEYFTPRSYYAGDDQSMFLKDLSQSGYKMVSRMEQLDFEHCYYTLKCLAKWHAYTVKLDKSGSIPDWVKKDILYDDSTMNQFLQGSLQNGVSSFIDSLEPSIKEKYAKQLDTLSNATFEKFIQDVRPRQNSFNVLNHGDFNIVNIMFKYDKSSNVKKVKFIDFQLCRWTSPVIDLIQFMTLSMKYEVYEKYKDLLLQIYLDTLHKVLVGLGCDITYTMSDLKQDIEQRYMFAFGLITALLSFVLTDPNELPFNIDDMNEKLVKGEMDPAMIKTPNQSVNKHSQEIATKWFLEYAEKGIFDLKTH